VEQEVKKLERKELEEICEQLNDILSALHTQSITSFNKKAESLVIEGTGWSSKVDAHKVDLLAHLTTLVTNCKNSLLIKLSESAQKDHELRLKDMIHLKISGLGEDFANHFRDSYASAIDEYNSNLAFILKRGFGMNEQQAFD
jgi:hypothetical protein